MSFKTYALLAATAGLLCCSPAAFARNSAKPKKPAAAPATKAWTVMEFVNGKNDIESDAFMALNLMETVGSNDSVNIVAEVGFMPGDGWQGSKRYFITKDDANELHSPVLWENPNTDMGDYKTVEDFVAWAKKNYPAKHYCLILWNHGSGFIDPPKNRGRGISFDAATDNYIKTKDIGTLLKDIGGVDVFGMDACLMQMAEVDYEIRDYAKVIIASEEVTLGYGFYYAGLLGGLTANPSAGPEDIAEFAVDSYSAFYKQYIPELLTLSAINAKALNDLPGYLNAWVEAALKAKDSKAFTAALRGVLRFKVTNKPGLQNCSGDLYNFVELASRNSKNAEVKRTGKELMSFIDKNLVLRNDFINAAENTKPRGLAIFIPGTAMPEVVTDYNTFAFSRDTRWPALTDWLQKLLIKSARIAEPEQTEPEQLAEPQKPAAPGKVTKPKKTTASKKTAKPGKAASTDKSKTKSRKK